MGAHEDIERRLVGLETVSVGGEVRKAKVTLCIYADDLDPPHVSRLIRCTPTRAARKGERDPQDTGQPPVRIGRWFLEAPAELDFEEKITFLLNRTTAERERWLELAANHRVVLSIGLFLSSWNEGVEFATPIVEQLATRGWAVGLDIYSADVEEVIEAFLSTGKRRRETEASED